jgi:hypothetical protein
MLIGFADDIEDMPDARDLDQSGPARGQTPGGDVNRFGWAEDAGFDRFPKGRQPGLGINAGG